MYDYDQLDEADALAAHGFGRRRIAARVRWVLGGFAVEWVHARRKERARRVREAAELAEYNAYQERLAARTEAESAILGEDDDDHEQIEAMRAYASLHGIDLVEDGPAPRDA